MTSSEWFARARRVLPGGVNSPVRAFHAVGGEPVCMVRGSGAVVRTADGADLIDCCGSWGALLFGHARPEVVEAIREAAAAGASFGANTPREVVFAERLCERAPSLERVRLVSSGTEAVMTALRLARGFTGRRCVVKFDGCYHGHSDSLLVAAGSGLLTGGVASSAGVSPAVAAETLVAPYNDPGAVDELVGRRGDDIAAILVEPVAANMGLVPPRAGFLEGLRAAADRCGALLIFDEVITGFRLGPATAGALYGVRPDLTCLGKVIGGGMPLGAVGGRQDVMERLAPLGPVYQAGTLSGNPVAVAAGLATLDLIAREDPYPAIERLGRRLADGLNDAARAAGAPLHCACLGSLFTPFFQPAPPRDLAEVKRCDTSAYGAFFRALLSRGVYLPPSQFEAGFVSAAHRESHISAILAHARAALDSMRP